MKIALVEIGGSHDECLYSQIKFIKSTDNIYLSLICNEKLQKNASLFDMVDEKSFIPLRSGIALWIDIFRLRQKLIKEKYDKIIFNTAQGSNLKKLLWFGLDKNTELIGLLHDTQKLYCSHSQKMISKKIRKYFLLSDYLLQDIRQSIKKNLILETFYPIFFPNYREITVNKEKFDLWICIPGQVELKRRDYIGLFRSIKKNGINHRIKFILLGPCQHPYGDGEYIKQEITKHNVKDNFMLWNDFIYFEQFHSIIKKSDFILPLIHPEHASYSLYKYQITGAFNLAIGYKKPLLLETSFSEYEDFKHNSIFYRVGQMMQTINTLKKQMLNNPYYKEKKWNFDFQKNKYMKILNKKHGSSQPKRRT